MQSLKVVEERSPHLEDQALRAATKWQRARLKRQLFSAMMDEAHARVEGDPDVDNKAAKVAYQADEDMRQAMLAMMALRPRTAGGACAVLDVAAQLLFLRKSEPDADHEGDALQLVINVRGGLEHLDYEEKLYFDRVG